MGAAAARFGHFGPRAEGLAKGLAGRGHTRGLSGGIGPNIAAPSASENASVDGVASLALFSGDMFTPQKVAPIAPTTKPHKTRRKRRQEAPFLGGEGAGGWCY